MATNTVPQTTDTALDPTSRPDRRAMLDLIHEAIMADGLPVPNCIAFYEKHPDPKVHSIGMHVDSLDDRLAWRVYLGGELRGLLADWYGWPVMVHAPAPPRVVDPVDAQADALLADLAAIPVTVGTVDEVAAKIGGAAPPTNPNWPVDERTAREATPIAMRWTDKRCTTCGYYPPCQCPGFPFGTGTGLAEAVTR